MVTREGDAENEFAKKKDDESVKHIDARIGHQLLSDRVRFEANARQARVD